MQGVFPLTYYTFFVIYSLRPLLLVFLGLLQIMVLLEESINTILITILIYSLIYRKVNTPFFHYFYTSLSLNYGGQFEKFYLFLERWCSLENWIFYMGLARWDKESIRIPFSCKFWVSYQFWWVFLVGKDVQIGQRMITISTVGVPNTIRKLASHKLQSTLAVRYVIYNRKSRIFVS